MSSDGDSDLFVTIEVGPSQKAMFIPLDYFCQIGLPVFRINFYRDFIDAARRDRPIWLSDADYDNLGEFVTWLQTEKSNSIYVAQAELWIHAEKIGLPTLQNQVIDWFGRALGWGKPLLIPSFSMWICSNLPFDSELRSMLTWCVARSMYPSIVWVGTTAGYDADFMDEVGFLLENYPEYLQKGGPRGLSFSDFYVPDQSEVFEGTDSSGRQFLQVGVLNGQKRRRTNSASRFDFLLGSIRALRARREEGEAQRVAQPLPIRHEKNSQYLDAQQQHLPSLPPGSGGEPPMGILYATQSAPSVPPMPPSSTRLPAIGTLSATQPTASGPSRSPSSNKLPPIGILYATQSAPLVPSMPPSSKKLPPTGIFHPTQAASSGPPISPGSGGQPPTQPTLWESPMPSDEEDDEEAEEWSTSTTKRRRLA